jgi:N-acetylglucosaminyldiphosphoundecaprenol N-acetyl-beta-D-mannosaminyltransferase
MTEKIQLLNVKVDNITMNELVENFDKGMLLTMHVDMIMKLQQDQDFYNIIPKFDLVTCDSQFLYWGAKLLGYPIKERVSGSDFFPHYYNRHKDDPSIKIFICGAKPGVAEIAQEKINAKIGRKMVVGNYSPHFQFDQDAEELERMVDTINSSGATVLLVGLGAGRQEKFLVKYRDRLTNIHTFLPLGGTIDYEAQTLKRPPQWVTDWGMEWLYRLLLEPKMRWKRYIIHEPPVIWNLLLQRLGLYKNPFSK